jgi:hypothetical protein
LTPRSSVTVTGSYGLTDFVDSVNHCSPTEPLCCPPVGTCLAPSSTFCPPSADCCPPLPTAVGIAPSGCLLNSHQFAFQAGYNYQLNRRDQVAIIYGYQYFTYPVSNLGSFTTNHFHVLYGHRISGRMDLQIGGGPQITEINPVVGNSTTTATVRQLTGTGRASLRYRFPKSTIALSYDRVSTNGSGFFGGSNTDVARFSVLHPLNRLWTINGDVGYAHNSRLLPTATPGEPSSFQNVYAGFGIRRQFGRYLGGYLTYDYSDLSFNIPICNVTECGRTSQRNTVIIGLDWHPRPIRID